MVAGGNSCIIPPEHANQSNMSSPKRMRAGGESDDGKAKVNDVVAVVAVSSSSTAAAPNLLRPEDEANEHYEESRRAVLLDSQGATSEIGLVCRRGNPGPNEYNEFRSVLSVLFGFQEFSDLGDGLMRFFSTKEARELRLVHSEFWMRSLRRLGTT